MRLRRPPLYPLSYGGLSSVLTICRPNGTAVFSRRSYLKFTFRDSGLRVDWRAPGQINLPTSTLVSAANSEKNVSPRTRIIQNLRASVRSDPPINTLAADKVTKMKLIGSACSSAVRISTASRERIKNPPTNVAGNIRKTRPRNSVPKSSAAIAEPIATMVGNRSPTETRHHCCYRCISIQSSGSKRRIRDSGKQMKWLDARIEF